MSFDPPAANPAKLQKVAGVRIFEQAVEQIRSLIAAGTLRVGEKLPNELELSRQLNVSRSSVREALRVLEAEGLVEVHRGSGTFVAAPPSNLGRADVARWLEQREETLAQVLQVRASIEGLTATLAAVNVTSDELAGLRLIVAEQSVLAEQAARAEAAGGVADEAVLARLAALDADFHLVIGSASGNDIAHEIIAHIIPAFNTSNQAVLYLGRRARRMEAEHRLILAALERHDSYDAETAMRAHITEVARLILALESAPTADEPTGETDGKSSLSG
jgi:DNA-binding FadR family transcriptional regulator